MKKSNIIDSIKEKRSNREQYFSTSDVELSDSIARKRENKKDNSSETKEMEYRLYEQGHTARGEKRPEKIVEDAKKEALRKRIVGAINKSKLKGK